MIAQGSNGLSRGDQNAGVMAGRDMLSFVPLNLSAFDQSSNLKDWVLSWASTQTDSAPASVLSESDWPCAHPSQGTYVWAPPPAAMSAAVEWLALSIHKRSASTHIVVVPRLMTAWWRKILNKAADLIVTIPTGVRVWGIDQHEPLMCAICLPLSRNEPWRHKGTPRTTRVLCTLSELWKNDFERGRGVLCQLLGEARDLAAL